MRCSFVVPVVCSLATVTLAMSAPAGSIQPALARILADTPAGQHVSTLVYMTEQVDLEHLEAAFDVSHAPLRERHETVGPMSPRYTRIS